MIKEAQTELARDFSTNDLAIAVADCTKYGRVGPAEIWVYAQHDDRKWRAIELWVGVEPGPWRAPIERILRGYPAHEWRAPS